MLVFANKYQTMKKKARGHNIRMITFTSINSENIYIVGIYYLYCLVFENIHLPDTIVCIFFRIVFLP